MAGVESSPEAQVDASVAAGNVGTSVKEAADAVTGDEGAHESHPLQFEWSLWHDQPSKAKGWGQGLKEIASFATVEEFWALFNNLREPSRLPVGHTYSLFKKGIKPEWEDKTLTNGGEWRMQVPPVRRDLLDHYWVETVLTLIREGFESEESDDIAGVVVNVRKGGNRIAIWTISSAEEELQRTIGNRWRQAAIQTQNQMEYFTFKTLMKPVSKKRHLYTV